MKFRFMSIAVFAFSLMLSSVVIAQTNSSTAFETPAKHLIIIDHASNEILFEKNARIPMAPASMTKIMTASVVFDRIKSGVLSLDDEFIVSENAWRKGGAKSGSSTMFLKPKSKVSVGELLHGVIIQSGNDACITLAEGIAGSEAAFAKMMNEKAKELGLSSANFKNATGWPDEGHEISAYDLVKLARHSINTYPELYQIYAQKSFTWNGIRQANRNPLILANFLGADGLKTGHTEISKYGFVGSAVQDGQRRIFVVNGLESKAQRRSESLRIMRSAFSEFSVYEIYKKDALAGDVKVFMGKTETVPVMTNQDVNIGLAKLDRNKLKVQIKYLSPVPAPILKGDKIADLVLMVDGNSLKTVPLHAANDVKQKSLVGRLLASLIHKIRGE